MSIYIVEEPKDGATVTYFECPVCDTKWIADHHSYKIDTLSYTYNGALQKMIPIITSHCPRCNCETRQSENKTREEIVGILKTVKAEDDHD